MNHSPLDHALETSGRLGAAVCFISSLLLLLSADTRRRREKLSQLTSLCARGWVQVSIQVSVRLGQRTGLKGESCSGVLIMEQNGQTAPDVRII